MKITVGTGCSAPIQLDTGTVQGSVLSPLLFDLFLNALLRLLDATGITHGIKRTPQWNHVAFADDLSIYVCTVKDANKILDVIQEFESWSGLRISIPKSLATGAMYGTGTARRQEGAKAETTKRKRHAGPDIVKPQIQALGAMDEALDNDKTAKLSTKGQEAWRFNSATMYRQCPVCNKKKGNCHFPTQLHLKPPCLECKHAWKPSGIKYNGTALKVIHGKRPIRLLDIRYNMWLDSTAQRRYVMDGITELACFLRKNRDLSIEDNAVGLIFRSALPEELESNNRAEDVALSLDAIKRCLINMLVTLDRETPQTKKGLALPTNSPTQEPIINQEPLWLWFTLPELEFPLLMDPYCIPLHPEIEKYMRRYVSNDRDWEEVDDEDCWGINYTEPTAQIKAKIETILHIWGEEQPEEEQDEVAKPIPERERFSVPHASRDPRILKDMNLENEDIFEIIRNPPEKGAVRIFEKPEFWDSTKGLTQAITTQGIATIQLSSGPLSMDGAQRHLLKHTLTNASPNSLGSCLQNELTRQLELDTDKKHRSFSWKLLRTLKRVFHATKYQGDTAITIPPFFKDAGRGKERIWGEETETPQPMVINWPGLNDKEKAELIPYR